MPLVSPGLLETGSLKGALLGGFSWHSNDKTADRVDDGRALHVTSLFSTRAMTSLTGV